MKYLTRCWTKPGGLFRIIIMLTLFGCKTIEREHTTEQVVHQVIVDTLHYADSLIYHESYKNDTLVIREREVINHYLNHFNTDTIYMEKQIVEKESSGLFYETVKSLYGIIKYVGGVAISAVIIILFVLWLVYKLKNK